MSHDDHDDHDHAPAGVPGGAHAGHDHRAASERSLSLAALLTGGFMLAEVAGGLLSGSLALLADAGHMLTDAASLGLAWFAVRLARRPATWRRTFGFDRFSVLAAFVNGLALFAIAGVIVVEAARRLTSPAAVMGGPMVVLALLGLAVNVLAYLILTRGEGRNLNTRAAALHVAGDLLGSVAALVAGAVILVTRWTPIDPLLSVVVSLIILRNAWGVVAESGHILLEGVPEGLDPREIALDLARSVPGVAGVSHIHAWSISEDRRVATLEAELAPGADADVARATIKARLGERFGIGHATVETAPARMPRAEACDLTARREVPSPASP